MVSMDYAPAQVDETPQWPESGRTYAIAFDMDTEELAKRYDDMMPALERS